MVGGVGQLAQGRPQDGGDLVRAGGERGQAVPDANHRQHVEVGHGQVGPVQAAEHPDPGRVEADLLLGLPEGGRDPVGVPGLDRAPGQADLAGVLAQVAGPLDQHQLQVVGPLDRGQGEQHRRRHPGRVPGDHERQPGHPVQQRVAHPPSIGPIRPGHAEPSVDHQGGAGDVAPGVGGEQQQRPGQLLDVGPAAHRDLGDQGPAGLRVRPHAAGELGPDPAGGQAVDPHPVGGRLDGQGAGERDHPQPPRRRPAPGWP